MTTDAYLLRLTPADRAALEAISRNEGRPIRDVLRAMIRQLADKPDRPYAPERTAELDRRATLEERNDAPEALDPLDQWPAFARQVRARLRAGRATYGDRSFSREPDALLVELQQEALDLAGWGFVLFARIERAREALATVESRGDDE